MDKIIFLSELSKLATDIFEQLGKTFDVKLLGYNVDLVRSYIKDKNPILILAYVKDLPYESQHALHLLLASEKIPFVLLGSKNECNDFFNQGNIKKIIITPIAIKDLSLQVESVVDMIEGRLSREDIKKMEAQEKDKMENQKHILLVDDDLVTLRTVMNYLKDDFRISVAKSATAAISLLGKEIPDLILLDYEMPICDGLQTLKLIRSEKRFEDIPVFFLTGVDDTDKVKAAVELKPEGYILKSTPQNQILEKIKLFFENN